MADATPDDMLSDLLAKNAALFAAYGEWSAAQIMLLAGTADDPDSFNADGGKTGALGYYPVVNVSGQTIYVPCMARLKAIALGGANADTLAEVLGTATSKIAEIDVAKQNAETATTATVAAKDTAIAATEDAQVATEQARTQAQVAQAAAQNADTVGDLRTFFARRGAGSGISSQARWRVANRLYGTLDAKTGFRFYKVTLPATAKIDDNSGMLLADRLLSSPVGPYLRRPAAENSQPSNFRVKIGNRLYVTVDAVAGLFPRRLTMPLSAKFEDGSVVTSRLVGSNAGDKFKGLAPELGKGVRWRIANRIYATLDKSGFRFYKVTLPAATKIDDDLTATLASRLVAAGMGALFKRLGAEAGGVLRIRLGNREIARWSKVAGMQFSRQTLPADCKIADQPTVSLIDRLSGSGRAASSNANYLALATLDANGRSQISTRRRSDSKRFQITSGASGYRAPLLTSDDKVMFDSDADGRMMFAAAEGGAIWPVDPYDIIDCWGDSLTAGAGATGGSTGTKTFPAQLAARLGSVATVNNRGAGGQISADITARQGGAPALISVSGNQIPASGAVTVTAYNTDLLYGSGISGVLVLTGTLAGVAGTLSGNAISGRNAATYTFTRAAAGAAVACPANTPFIPDLGVASRPRVQIMQYGRNDGASSAATTLILNALQASVGYQTAYMPRFLVGGVIAQIGDTLASFNTLRDTLAAAYPGRFVDINATPTVEEMFTIGFVPDSYGAYTNGRTDAQDLAAGYIPSGMRSGATTGNGDFLHGNDFFYALLALRYYRAIVAKGWWPSLPTV